MPGAIVTLTTDFGEGSRYVAAMKGVLLAHSSDIRIVDISHTVPHQDLLQGAIVLDEATRWFPPGTIHIAVVDPGVGSERRILYAEFDGQRYIAPDNGLFTCLAERARPTTMRVIESLPTGPTAISHTFHGRDIMAPAAAQLTEGLDPADLGPVTSDFVRIPLPKAVSVGQQITGEVVEVDSFGNLITNISADMLAGVPHDDTVRIKCDDHETIGIYQTYSDQPPMTLVALVGSGDKLELAIVDDSAKIMLGVGVGAEVVVAW